MYESAHSKEKANRTSQNIAIISQPGAEVEAITKELKRDTRFKVREFLSIEDVNEGLASYQFDLLVMRLNTFDTAQVNMVLKTRQRFPDAGLITMSPHILPTARYQVKDVPRHKLLLEPFELRDISWVAGKLTRHEQTATRLHPRVDRQGECELIAPEQGSRIRGKFLDFAQMGTRLIVQPKVPLKKGTQVELQYRSTTEPSRIHRIQSHIVWAEMSSGMMGTIMHGPQQTVGVRFIAAL